MSQSRSAARLDLTCRGSLTGGSRCRRGIVATTLIVLLILSRGPRANADDRIETWLPKLEQGDWQTRTELLELIGTYAPHDADLLKRLEPLLDESIVAGAAATYLLLGGDPAAVRNRLKVAEGRMQFELARGLLSFDETDRLALEAFAQSIPEVWQADGTLQMLSGSLETRLVSEMLSRIERLPPQPEDEPEFDDDGQQNRDHPAFWDWVVIDQAMSIRPEHLPRLIALGRSVTKSRRSAYAATEILVRDFAREPSVAEEFRSQLTESSGERQLLLAIGLLQNDPENPKAWLLLRLALEDPDPKRRLRVALRLNEFKLPAPRLLPQLLRGQLDRGPWETSAYTADLARIGAPAAERIVDLATPGADKPPFTADTLNRVVPVLQRIGPEAKVALPFIREHYRVSDSSLLSLIWAIDDEDESLAIAARVLDRQDQNDRELLCRLLCESPPERSEIRARLRELLVRASRQDRGAMLLQTLRMSLALGEPPEGIGRRLIVELNDPVFDPIRHLGSLEEILRQLGPESATVFEQAPRYWRTLLPQSNAAMRCSALAAAGERGVPLLVAQLGDPEPAIRDQACWALGEIGPPAHRSVPALIERLRDDSLPDRESDEPIWLHAARALGRIGKDASAALGPLKERLDDPHRYAAAYVLRALGGIAGPEDRDLLDTLRPFLGDESLDRHIAALSTWIVIAPDDLETEDAVRDLLRRFRLHEVLDVFSCEDKLDPVCRRLIEHPSLAARIAPDAKRLFGAPIVSRVTRVSLASVLIFLDPPDQDALAYLEELAANGSYRERVDAREAIARRKSRPAPSASPPTR